MKIILKVIVVFSISRRFSFYPKMKKTFTRTSVRGIILRCCTYRVGMSEKTFLREHMKCTANIKEETWSISFNSMSIREDLFNDDTLILLNQY